ncbi:MAG TPA: ABC transporter permease [Stellaceae bacterium]|nr:ABC transporter permease [Stellaceae bacterium]
MLGNLATAAWRAACRDRLHAILNVLGLSLGFAATILIGLFVRDELSFDTFLPDHQHVYTLQPTFSQDGRAPESYDSTPSTVAAEFETDFPETVAIARLAAQQAGLRHGEVEANERLVAADPSFFQVLGYPLLRGDPATALARPDSLALSKALALKYFGTIDCIGQTMEIDRQHTVTVDAVLAEPPFGSNETIDALLSGNSSYSALTEDDAEPRPPPGSTHDNVATYLRLRPGTDPAALRDRLDRFVPSHYPMPPGETRAAFRLWLRPITELHLHESNPDTPPHDTKLTTLIALSLTGTLILVVAGINFVNLVTARAVRRAVEVGVRKAVGATHRQLVLQFMGEAVAFAMISLVLAIAAVELALPGFDAFIGRTIGFDYWRDPLLAPAMLGIALIVGLAAGLYPALVQASFRPAETLKGGGAGLPGSGRLRQLLVVLQFAVSIGLLIATGIIWRQTDFATRQSLTFDIDQILTIELGAVPRVQTAQDDVQHDPALVEALKTSLASLPGVRGVTGSDSVPNTPHTSTSTLTLDDRPAAKLSVNIVPIDFNFFKLYGLRPVAGRDFDQAHADDFLPPRAMTGSGTTIINETAARLLGFTTPAAALGHTLRTDEGGQPGQIREIVGVVPDMQLNTARTAVPPTAYLAAPYWDQVLSVKLDGRHMPETLTKIDRLWQQLVPARPIQRRFLDARIEEMYRDVRRETAIFGAFALVAATIACLGLFGLSAFTAERRTKEIGIRKALGASTADVVRLLVWQFTRPVLVANAIAWPVAGWLMHRWLEGYAYRIALEPGLFLAAGTGAVAIAMGTTAFHAFQVARARPVAALRYE